MPAGAYDPCIDGEVSAYFNRVDVQAAFHANSSGNRLPYAWESCSSKVLYSRFASHPISCSHRVLTLLQSRLARKRGFAAPNASIQGPHGYPSYLPLIQKHTGLLVLIPGRGVLCTAACARGWVECLRTLI